ncbi:hypothetical protein COEX109129_03145 [Corallococcus exiguus]
MDAGAGACSGVATSPPALGASTVVAAMASGAGEVLPPSPAASDSSVTVEGSRSEARASASRAAVSPSCSAEPRGRTAMRAASRRRASSSCCSRVAGWDAPAACASPVFGCGASPWMPSSASTAPGVESSATSGGWTGHGSKRCERGPPSVRHAGSLHRRSRSRAASRSTGPWRAGAAPFSDASRAASSRAGLDEEGPRGTTPGARGRAAEDEGVRPEFFRSMALAEAFGPWSRMRTVPPAPSARGTLGHLHIEDQRGPDGMSMTAPEAMEQVKVITLLDARCELAAIQLVREST